MGLIMEVAEIQQTEVQNEVQPEGVQNENTDGLQEEGQKAAQEVVEKPKDEPIPKGVQKRIDRAVRQKYEAEARANELERRLQQLEQSQVAKVPEGAPKYEDFNNDFDAYSRAVARYEANQVVESTLSSHKKAEAERQAQAAQVKTAESWAKRVAAATVEMPDFDEVLASSDIQFKDPAILQAIQESDIGPKIAYYLASNPDEADDIAELTGAAAIRAIGRLEAKIEDKKVSVTKTPAPINPVNQRAKVEKAPEEMTPKEFDAWRKKFIATRGSR